MRIAALVPTRNRALTVRRAALSFLDALSDACDVTSVRLVIVDDSDVPREVNEMGLVADQIRVAHANVALEFLPSKSINARMYAVAAPGGGPGAARNRGLLHLQAGPVDHDVTIFFDDDVCFGDVEYRSARLMCDGVKLLRDALKLCETPNTVVGCGYVGRQDLSILEHARLNTGGASPLVAPATDRAHIENVAPGGISTAFLTIASSAHRLPMFPEHYNEDYVWLHALNRAGWSLRRVESLLVHAPPGEVAVTAEALSFQVFGEIVWLVISERDRFPFEVPSALAAAIDEIVGDVGEAIADAGAFRWPAMAEMLREVKRHYEALRDDTLAGRQSVIGKRLNSVIQAGLALGPKV
jgi:hypothetical protein